MRLKTFFAAAAVIFTASAIFSEDNVQPQQKFSFDLVKAQAEKLAKAPYNDKLPEFPPEIKYMNYDNYNLICCNRDLWNDPRLRFEITFFHIGNLYLAPVKINEIIKGISTEFKFKKDYFTFNKPTDNIRDFMPDDAGFAGFRVISRSPEFNGERAVFLGASYFRVVSPGASFGLSARGLSINSGLPGIAEEFPRFKEFWIEKPLKDSDNITIYALMDSESVSGAYSFAINVDKTITVKTTAVVYPRKKTDNVGFAHLTSMFWLNEVRTWPFFDFRPNIHNSDGLIISGDGKQIWEPLVNYPYFPIIITDIPIKKLNYYGLLQRNRNFYDYNDLGVNYHLNPSIWFVPDSNWGNGKIRLVQMPTLTEWMDNINSMWIPDEPLEPGKPIELKYTMYVSQKEPEEQLAKVTKTLLGKQMYVPLYEFSVNLAGGGLASIESLKDLTADLKTSDKIEVTTKPMIQRIPDNNINVTFVIKSLETNPYDKPAETLELTLRDKSGKQLSETWYYRWYPYFRQAPAP